MFATSSAVTIRRSARTTCLMSVDPIPGSKGCGVRAAARRARETLSGPGAPGAAARRRQPRTREIMPSKARGFRLSHGYLPMPAEAGGHSRNSGVETMWVLLIVLVGSAGVATTIISGYPTKGECEAARAQIDRVPDLINLPQGQCVPGPGAH